MAENTLPFPLSTPGKTIAEIINEVVNQTLSRMVLDKPNYTNAMAFLVELVGGSSTFTIMTADGVETWQKQVFLNSSNRELILTLYSAFRARYAARVEDWDSLIEVLSDALSIPALDTVEEYSLIPGDINDRLFDRDTCKTMLKANAWLVVLVLILLYWNSTPTVVSAMSQANGGPKLRERKS